MERSTYDTEAAHSESVASMLTPGENMLWSGKPKKKRFHFRKRLSDASVCAYLARIRCVFHRYDGKNKRRYARRNVVVLDSVLRIAFVARLAVVIKGTDCEQAL